MATEGEIIQQLIDNKGFGQGEFADRIGIARSSLNRIIKGKKPLGKINQKRIAEGLGLSKGMFLWLLDLDIPLENLAVLQALAAEKDKEILSAIEALLKISQIKKRGKISSHELSSLLSHINSSRNFAESLDK